MADTRLRAIIESIYDSKGTDAAKKGFSDVGGAGDQASGGVEKLSGSTNALSGVLGKLAAAGILAKIGQEALEFGKASVQAAGDAAEMQSKFNVVFGESAPQAQAALQELGDQVNRSAIDLQGMAASIQDTFVPLGFARDQAADLSVQLTQLAVDVGSFNNVADADVMRDFQSALVGNTETVRKYGIVITEANTKQKAYEMGIAEVGSALTEQEKVQARLQLILEGTTDAQGDAIRTSESYANTMKGLEAATMDLKIAIGEQLNPALAEGARLLTGMVKETTPNIQAQLALWNSLREGNITYGEALVLWHEWILTGKDATDVLDELDDASRESTETVKYWELAIQDVVDAEQEWAENTFYAAQALELQTDNTYKAYITSEKFADRLQLVNDKAKQLTEALHNALPSIDEMRDALNQDISSPLDGFINDIQFFVASGGRDFVAEYQRIQQNLANALAAPGDDSMALQQAKEDAAALLVDIQKVKIEMGEKTTFEAAQEIADSLGIALDDAMSLLKDFDANADEVFGTEREFAINQESLDQLHQKLQEAEGSINMIEGEHEVVFNITQNGAIPTLDGADVTNKGTPAVANAGGGDVYAGQRTWVGEQGTEMFIPDVSGTIVPNNQIGGMMGNVNVAPPIVYVFLDTAQVAAKVEVRQGQTYRQRTGGGYRP